MLAMTAFHEDEMLGNVMVVQWFLFPVALLIMLQIRFGETPLGRARLIWYSVVMAVICLTVPLLGVFFPIAVRLAVQARGLAAIAMNTVSRGPVFWSRFGPSPFP